MGILALLSWWWSNGNIFRVTGHLCAQRPVTQSLMFSLTCAWINCWVNNGEAGVLRRHRAHYNVTEMMAKKTVGEKIKWLRSQNYTSFIYWKAYFVTKYLTVTRSISIKLRTCASKPLSVQNLLMAIQQRAVISTNVGLLLIQTRRANLNAIWNKKALFSVKNMSLNISSEHCRPFCRHWFVDISGVLIELWAGVAFPVTALAHSWNIL